MKTVTEKLETYWKFENKSQDEPLTLGITSPLPLQDLFNEIDAHFLRRKKHKELEASNT